MPIRIDYSPVPVLLNLAQAAGETKRREEGARLDIAFTQMAMQTATRNAQIAAQMQASDRAFELQKAAAARQERTMMARIQARDPVADSVLERMKWREGVEQEKTQTQLEQLETMRGSMTPEEYERAKLRTMAGGRLSTFREEKPTLTANQQIAVVNDKYDRDITQSMQIQKRLNAYLRSPGLGAEDRSRMQAELDAVNEGLRTSEQQRRAEINAIAGGTAVVDPITKRVATGAGPAPTAGPAAGPAATLAGQPSVARMKAMIARARSILAGMGNSNPSEEEVLATARMVYSQSQPQ